MPPPSPVPGWARGDVWRERTARRRMALRAYRRPGIPLRPGLQGAGLTAPGSGGGDGLGGGGGGQGPFGRYGGGFRDRLAAIVLVVAAEGEVDPDEGLLL